jgi:hypothetical protein
MILNIGTLGATCKTVSSATYPAAVVKKWTVIPSGTETQHPEGYDAKCGCWKEGFRPQQFTIYGPDPHVSGNPWPVCAPTTAAAKPAPTAPVATNTRPPTTTVTTTPVVAPAVHVAPTPTLLSEYGPTLGFLLAMAVIGGSGYYAYKKGAFGKKRGKR